VPAGNSRVTARVVSVVVLCAAVLGLAGCAHSSDRSLSTDGSDPPSSSEPAATGTSASTTTTTSSGGPASARVDVFGDSLVVQARDALRVEGRAHGLNVDVAAYYGLAPCDLLGTIRHDLVSPPRALVIAFSGNNITPCMAPGGHELTGAPYYAAYRRDVSAIVAAATARNVPVLVVGPPRLAAVKNVPDRIELTSLFVQIVSDYPGARYEASAPALTPNGFTSTLPCDPGETAALGCSHGIITVRGPDQIHFDAPRTVPCPTGHDQCEYSAGAHRYADAVLAGLAPIAALHYRPAPSTTGVPVDLTQVG
jgi:hypothetical protein